MDWPTEIAKALLVQEVVKNADRFGVFRYGLPGVAVEEERLLEVEHELGHRLDEHYRRFLCFADGWQGFYQSVDLFGTSDLVASDRIERAAMLLRSIDKVAFEAAGVMRDSLFPVSVAMNDVDVFVICRDGNTKGQLIWFAGQEVERFANFDQYFLAMIDYNRRVYQQLKELGT
jgi:hypothetical protein